MASPHNKHDRLEPNILSRLWKACDLTDTAPLAKLIDTYNPPITDLAPGFWSAMERNNYIMMRYLLDRGMPVRPVEIEMAVRAKSIAALEMLKEYGWEDVDINLGEGICSAHTALSLAVSDPAMVAYLLKLGANPNIGPKVDSFGAAEMLHMSPNSGSILRGAVRIGNLESINLLISYGAEITNASLMHPATICGKTSVMARVLELGANIDEKDDMLKTGYPTYGTPLLRAIKTRDTNAVRFLLERGASVFQPGYDGWTPLQVVRMECCGGLSLPVCRIHGMDILPEMAQLIETAVKKEGEQHQVE